MALLPDVGCQGSISAAAADTSSFLVLLAPTLALRLVSRDRGLIVFVGVSPTVSAPPQLRTRHYTLVRTLTAG